MDINFLTQASLDFMLLFTIIAPLLCAIFALVSSDTSRIRDYGIITLSIFHLINVFNIKYFYDNYGSFSYQFVKLGNVVEFSFATEQYGIIFAIFLSKMRIFLFSSRLSAQAVLIIPSTFSQNESGVFFLLGSKN